jgi:hypothetical protein
MPVMFLGDICCSYAISNVILRFPFPVLPQNCIVNRTEESGIHLWEFTG